MDMIFLAISLLIAITFHESAHAYVAMVLGDPTAKLRGRVSLNPMKHLDPFGTIMIIMTFLSGFGIGWGKPVPVNPYNFKDYKKGEALTALAGPMSNFILALIASFFLRYLGDVWPIWAVKFISVFIMLNLGLMCFNLIPVPPLDGSKILFLFIPNKYYYLRPKLEKNGPIILLIAIIAGQFLGLPILMWVISPMIKTALFLLGL